MRFLSKIRERQFAKKWGGTYNLSRAVLAGVLAAGCLMPGFAEAAVLHMNYGTYESEVVNDGIEGVHYTKVEKTANITNFNGINDTADYVEIFWANEGAIVEDCTIKVNDVNSPNMPITPDIIISCGPLYNVNAISNTVNISNVIFARTATIYGGIGGYSYSGTAYKNSVSISGGTFNGYVGVFGGYSPDGEAYANSVRNSGINIVEENVVDIKSTTFNDFAEIAGGKNSSGLVTNNSVSIFNTTFNDDFSPISPLFTQIYGGQSSAGDVTKNTVEISGNTKFEKYSVISGGYSDSGEANGNSVIIKGGTFNSVVSGGISAKAANANRVIISGGTFDQFVFGGHPISGEAKGNQVIIKGGEFKYHVFGGGDADIYLYGEYGETVANDNQVIISGGTFKNVYGGYVESASGTATNNKVILVGNNANYKFTDTQGDEHNLTGGNITIQGYVTGGYSKGDHSGNKLHVYGSGTEVKGIANFDNLNFYINDKITSADVMLKITGEGVTDISKSKVEVTFDGAPPAKDELKPITLIQKTDAGEESIIKAPSKNNITVNCGPALTGSVDLENYGKDLVLTLKNFTVNENGKSLVETRAAAAFVVNNMSDFMLDTGMEQAKAAAGGVAPIDAGTMAPFAAVGGSNMRYITGSYVDVNGWNGAVGLAKQADKLLFGVAAEHGRGNYDSYLDNGVHASGDIKSTGGVIFGEYKLDNGVHYDAALRAGRVKSDYNSTATSYDESSTYYGFSLGGGKELTVSDKATLDVYGRYYFSHTNGSDVSIATGEEIDFDAVNSHRLRIGGRYTTTLTEKSKAYAGLAWQYEFGGDAKAAINGYSAPTPSLQGHSAIVEAGYKLNAGKNLTLDFNLNGAMGKQRGIGGGIGAQWLF